MAMINVETFGTTGEDYETPRFEFHYDVTESTRSKSIGSGPLKNQSLDAKSLKEGELAVISEIDSNESKPKKQLFIMMEDVLMTYTRKTSHLRSSSSRPLSYPLGSRPKPILNPNVSMFLQRVSRDYEITLLTTTSKTDAEKLFQELKVDRSLSLNVIVINPNWCFGADFLTKNLIWENLGIPLTLDYIFLTSKSSCAYFFDTKRMLELRPFEGESSDQALIELIPFLEYYSSLTQTFSSVETFFRCFQMKKTEVDSASEAEKEDECDEDDEECNIAKFVCKLAKSNQLKTKVKLG
eukprot:CAMPEP_0176468922 /NCGR_PEP_ID=MMETSP0127-20121128/39430_1 /TAXON_ID=938130 /ORGANISM="Platyophrya macrostoma, Strain WH" /LENGTH=295 /DNA_ID=CAMNT_0017862681 /DNA_START=26 /DNA_END=913 /DNA_ORIENTATION=-